MKPRAASRVLWSGLALLLGTNAVVLAGALYNRSGEREATLRLSQRELDLPYRWGFERENSGISLELRWRLPVSTTDPDALHGEGTPWLDKAKLSELGFDSSPALYTPDVARRYAKQLPREVLLVLELDGAAYRAALQRAEQRVKRAGERAAANAGLPETKSALDSATGALEDERYRNSRLFVVDAGRDAAALRTRYSDRSRYVIAPGVVRLSTRRHGSDAVPFGYVSSLSVSAVNVPAAYRAPFASAYKESTDGAPAAGKYEAVVAFGKKLEPWIMELRRTGK
jgi:hypothetical protein